MKATYEHLLLEWIAMKTQYIKHKKQWSAFITLNGLDIQEYGDNESEAKNNLINRISKSEFLLKGIKL